jgi:hypothetical protein
MRSRFTVLALAMSLAATVVAARPSNAAGPPALDRHELAALGAPSAPPAQIDHATLDLSIAMPAITGETAEVLLAVPIRRGTTRRAARLSRRVSRLSTHGATSERTHTTQDLRTSLG